MWRNCNWDVARMFLTFNKRSLRLDCEIVVAFFLLNFLFASERFKLLHGRLVERLLARIHNKLLAGQLVARCLLVCAGWLYLSGVGVYCFRNSLEFFTQFHFVLRDTYRLRSSKRNHVEAVNTVNSLFIRTKSLTLAGEELCRLRKQVVSCGSRVKVARSQKWLLFLLRLDTQMSFVVSLWVFIVLSNQILCLKVSPDFAVDLVKHIWQVCKVHSL